MFVQLPLLSRRVVWRTLTLASAACAVLLSSGCTQESQNKFGRAIQNWTGTDGVLEFMRETSWYIASCA